MNLSSSIIVQLTGIVLLATILFFVAYRLPQAVSSFALLAIIPIQPIDTRYASANVLLTFVVFGAMLMKSNAVKLPMIRQFLILLFCYLVSTSFVHKALFLQHAVYIVAFVSSYMVLCIAYDLAMGSKNIKTVTNVFLAMNVIVAIYCAIQIYVGPGVKVVPFGIQEMTMIPGRKDNRLTGPFAATGVTSEYFVIMSFMIVYRLLLDAKRWFRTFLLILAGANLAFLVATGNRGGFLSLIGGAVMFLWFFRHELGVVRVVKIASAGGALLVFSSFLIINYTDYGRLFERLEATTIEEGVPDTRQYTWPRAWEKIKERPIFGHGPRYMMIGGEDGARYPTWEFQNYPHNLYLFLLSTIGVIGLLAFLNFIFYPLFRCWRASRFYTGELALDTLVKIGVIVFIVLVVDQLKVEFMRIALVDYWHFVFAFTGVFIAACDQVRVRGRRRSS